MYYNRIELYKICHWFIFNTLDSLINKFIILTNVQTMAPLHVWWECFVLTLISAYKQIVFLIWPDERRKDLEQVTASYNLDDEGKKKFLFWRNHETVKNFFYTWNMISDHFYT